MTLECCSSTEVCAPKISRKILKNVGAYTGSAVALKLVKNEAEDVERISHEADAIKVCEFSHCIGEVVFFIMFVPLW